MRMIRTDSSHKDFVSLVALLDAELAKRDGDDHAFYHQFNSIDNLKHTVVFYQDKQPVACGAMKEFDPVSMEIKRMYTLPEFRGMGLATKVLAELEKWAAELDYEFCILETGKRQPEAIALYTRRGYKTIPNYGQYAGIENSCCFEKKLSS